MKFIYNNRKKIMLFGSSMTQRSFNLDYSGWGARLADWYCRTADVLNRGAGGYNSHWLKEYLPQLIGNEKPDLAILFIGNNDSIRETERQHVSIENYRLNILSMVNQLIKINQNILIILVTTTRVNEQLKPLHSNQRRQSYANVIKSIYTKRKTFFPNTNIENIALIDLWDTHKPYSIYPEDLHDGSHLGKEGNKKFFEALKQTINFHFPFFSPDNIKHKSNKKALTENINSYQNDHLNLSSSQIHHSKNDFLTKVSLKRSLSDGLSPHYKVPKGHVEENQRDLNSNLQLTVPLWRDII